MRRRMNEIGVTTKPIGVTTKPIGVTTPRTSVMGGITLIDCPLRSEAQLESTDLMR